MRVTAHTHAAPGPNGADTVTEVTIKNVSKTPTVGFFLRADVRRGTSAGVPAAGDNQVLPIFWTDNDVTLWPGESQTLQRHLPPLCPARGRAGGQRDGSELGASGRAGAVTSASSSTLESRVAHRALVQREADPPGGPLCGSARRLGRPLGEPEHARVVAEVVVAQVRVAVEAELADDRVLECPREEVGQEVRARLLLQRRADLVAPEDVIAVVAVESRDPVCGQQLVDRPCSCRSPHTPPPARRSARATFR